jgi:ABC-type siderophore export system fused ATPase/permease subunit
LHKTIIMVTHDPRAAIRAQRILHLEKGQLVEDAPREGAAAGARDGSTAIMAVKEESTTFPSR